MPSVLGSGAGLSERAVRFLRANAVEVDCGWDAVEDRAGAVEVAEHYGLAVADVLAKLANLRDRVGGLRYESRAWSFEEVITFAPCLDFDPDDPEPVVSLIEHSVAHPFGVWATLGGVVGYMFPGDHGGKDVLVFDRPECVIEADALYWECADWTEVPPGGPVSLAAVESHADTLTLLGEASGTTEKWWAGDGFRLHVWRTYAKVFMQGDTGSWQVWASGPSGVDNARRFLADAG